MCGEGGLQMAVRFEAEDGVRLMQQADGAEHAADRLGVTLSVPRDVVGRSRGAGKVVAGKARTSGNRRKVVAPTLPMVSAGSADSERVALVRMIEEELGDLRADVRALERLLSRARVGARMGGA